MPIFRFFVGTDIAFYAVIAINIHSRLVRLTLAFSFIKSASDGRDHMALYLAFTAASVLQAQIIQDNKRL